MPAVDSRSAAREAATGAAHVATTGEITPRARSQQGPRSFDDGRGSVSSEHTPVERLALRPKEAAEALGIGERTLRQILPELPHVRIGGAVLLPGDGLRERGERCRMIAPDQQGTE